MPAGRPPMPYDEEVADSILDAIARGNSLVSILKEDEELPSYSTIMKWLRQNPEFAANYARAREDQGDYDADKIREVVDQVIAGTLDPNAARVAMDGLKWNAGKRKPKVYGEKLAIGGDGDAPPIKTTTQLDISNLTLEQLDTLGEALKVAIGKD